MAEPISLFQYVTGATAVAGLTMAIVNFIRTSRIADRQYTLSFSQDVIKWASEVLQTFQKVHIICDDTVPNVKKYEDVLSVCSSVSILWDQGRFLFPNKNIGSYQDSHKEEAYKGVRRKILDYMSAYHHLLSYDLKSILHTDIDEVYKMNEQAYVTIRRGFVSEVQTLVKTRSRFVEAKIDKDQ